MASSSAKTLTAFVGSPFIEEIPEAGILSKVKLNFSRFPANPQFGLGFNHWIHKGKDKTAILEKPENAKRKEVVNPYEHKVTDYNLDINTTTKMYFKLKSDEAIVSRAFYKLWELLMLIGMCDKKESMTSVHLAEAPGAFIQATMMFREKYFGSSSTKDKHIATSIIVDAKKAKAEHIPEFDKRIKSNPKVNIWECKDCDLTNPSILEKISNDYEGKADFITADGGFNWLNENYQEQEAVPLLLAEILAAFRMNTKGGSFVLKVFDMYTDVSLQLITLLKMAYEKVYLTKPLTSRPSNSERYLVCLGYKGIPKTLQSQLESAIDTMYKDKDNYVTNIFDDYEAPDKLIDFMQCTSIRFSNEQLAIIHEMLGYIAGGNYFGTEYRAFLERQRKANDYWIATFYPIDERDFKVVRNNMNEVVKKASKC